MNLLHELSGIASANTSCHKLLGYRRFVDSRLQLSQHKCIEFPHSVFLLLRFNDHHGYHLIVSAQTSRGDTGPRRAAWWSLVVCPGPWNGLRGPTGESSLALRPRIYRSSHVEHQWHFPYHGV